MRLEVFGFDNLGGFLYSKNVSVNIKGVGGLDLSLCHMLGWCIG